jgi:hypothetical protein
LAYDHRVFGCDDRGLRPDEFETLAPRGKKQRRATLYARLEMLVCDRFEPVGRDGRG